MCCIGYLIYIETNYGKSYWNSGEEAFGARHFATIFPDEESVNEETFIVGNSFHSYNRQILIQEIIDDMV